MADKPNLTVETFVGVWSDFECYRVSTALKEDQYGPMRLHATRRQMPSNCETFIHRFDSDRRLQILQQLTDSQQLK